MKKRIRLIIALVIIALFTGVALNACAQSEPEVDIDAQRTSFAQTADAQATMTMEAMPTATETPLPSPTFTATPVPTNTPDVTPTDTNGAVDQPGGGTDSAVVIIQEPPDNTQIRPGEVFSVTWTFENTGTSTWTTGYYIEFASGEQMGASDPVFMWLSVPPQRSLPVSVNLTAPQSEGTKRSNWKLFNANNVAFYDFHIIIDVSAAAPGQPTPTAGVTNTPEVTSTPGVTPTPEVTSTPTE